jgi:hypothetical protein
MYRIDNGTAAVAPPAPAALGTEGFWTKGNPAGGVPATQMDQDWFQALQENLIGVYTATGTAHSKSDYTRLTTALQALIAAGIAAGALAHGECRMALNGSNLKLSPVNGNKLFVAGVQRAIPAGGVFLAPTGLTGSTLYYVDAAGFSQAVTGAANNGSA